MFFYDIFCKISSTKQASLTIKQLAFAIQKQKKLMANGSDFKIILGNEIYNASVKRKIKQWYWCGVFGELYGSANETRYALDVPQLIKWIYNDNSELPKTIQDCNFSAMRLLSLQTKNSAAYKGIMAIIMQNNAKDWISGTEMSVTNYIEERSDIHHIFPQDSTITVFIFYPL